MRSSVFYISLKPVLYSALYSEFELQTVVSKKGLSIIVEGPFTHSDLLFLGGKEQVIVLFMHVVYLMLCAVLTVVSIPGLSIITLERERERERERESTVYV